MKRSNLIGPPCRYLYSTQLYKQTSLGCLNTRTFIDDASGRRLHCWQLCVYGCVPTIADECCRKLSAYRKCQISDNCQRL